MYVLFNKNIHDILISITYNGFNTDKIKCIITINFGDIIVSIIS